MRLLPKSTWLLFICFSFTFISFLIMLPTEWTVGLLRDRFQTLNDGIKFVGTNRFCQLKQNIVFLKVHKAGSSTVMNILQRFGLSKNLTFVLPKAGHYLGKTTTLELRRIMPLKPNDTYNILCNHVIYNREAFHSILKSRMFYFAILRSPFDQFVSAFYYYTHVYPNKYLLNVTGVNPISEYLKNPPKYEALLKDANYSYTNNRMAFDLGLRLSDVRNETKVSKYIKILDEDFDYMMIMEYFEISMVLLKRQLCWELKDILYVPKNIYSNRVSYKLGLDDFKRHREWAKADYMIYEHFLGVFWKKTLLEGPDLALEVFQYKTILTLTHSFCTSKNRSFLLVPQSKWNEEFKLTFKDCEIIMMGEMPLVYKLQQKHQKEYFSISNRR